MLNEQEFSPDWASAPGDTIKDILRDRNLTEIEFAQKIGQPFEDVKNLLQGRATITIDLARRLEGAIGASVEFWMSRDFQYRQDISRLNATHKNWLEDLPISDMIKFGWLKTVPHPREELTACLQFFNSFSIREWQETYSNLYQMVAFRTSQSYDSRPASVAAWLRQGEIEAESIVCNPWNAEHFRASLSFIRTLTRRKDHADFLPKLRQSCSECGVAVAVVPAPNGCRASGATRFLSKDKALLQLSYRYGTDDHFWFTFFHESGHLLLHGDEKLLIEGIDTSSSKKEEEANEFAARTLVPIEFLPTMLALAVDEREVIRFARKVGISPGIVVGQMQKMGKIGYNQLNSLKRHLWQD